MALLSPPRIPPRVAVGDNDRLNRFHFRCWQMSVTAITCLITAWSFTIGPVLGIIALMVAKHVLVAVLVMGMDLHPVQKADG